jgi:hypothetical protein
MKTAPLQRLCPEGARWLPLAQCATYKFKRGYESVAIRLLVIRVKLSNDATVTVFTRTKKRGPTFFQRRNVH